MPKKDSYAIFRYAIFFAFCLITTSGMLKADIKEQIKKVLDRLEEKSQEFREKAEYQICSAQCHHQFSDNEKLSKFACLKKCEIAHMEKVLKRQFLKQEQAISKKIKSITE